jgi:hypothetical protein
MFVYVTPSVENCHVHVFAPDVAHVPPVAVYVAPTAAAPAIVGAVLLDGAISPGVIPLPAVVEPLVRSAM